MAVNTLGLNRTFPIYNADGTSFNNLELRKAVVDSIVMSLGDKITGEVYYKDNSLAVTMHEYIDYNGVRYMLVNPPTVVREGMVSDNGQLNGMTKYSFEFYHPMYLLGNIPFNDVAVTADETRYLSENAVFSWIGYPDDLIAKLNKNLQGTEWIVVKSSRFPNEKDNELSEVIPFNNAMISDVLKTFYDTWGVPFVIGQVESTEAAYAQGKRFKVIFGLPYNEIYETPEDRSGDIPFVFQFGQGVGLKNNSRNPRNNKIVTRIAGYGAERNVPYGYPQIPWYGDSRWDWTEYEGDVINYDINDKVTNNPKSTAYPIYDGIVSGQPTRLIKHPFTRTHLMPSIYGELLFNKVSPYISGGGVNPSYNPNIQLKDFYDAIATQEYPYINEINPSAPSYQFKEFEKIYPELGEEYIYGVQPLNDDLTPAPDWDDSIDNDGNYNQSYFAITLSILSFDIYASAAITEEMEINMRSGACLGCTFQVQVDWEDYKNNFFNSDGEFDPIPHTAENDGHVRDAKKYPDSSQTRVTVIVKKDLETFGTLMPNIYQYPIAGDQFVVLGISMPQSYISNAETRLDAEMKTYMLENNVYYFDYPLKFDEKFLRDNTYILSQLRPNSIVRFNYAGQQLQLYVKQLTVKYGEKPLPQYDITLTDNVEVVLNQLGQVADDVERLSTLISIVRENYSRSVWAELAKKLSKVDDDTAQGTIRFLKGLQVGSRFVSGLLGSGGIFRRNADGKTYLETDNLYVRMKAYFDTVEVREYEHSHGGRIASSAGQKVSHVVKMGYYPEGSQTKVPLDDNNNYHYIDPVTGDETLIPLDVCCYRCYYRAKENRDTTEQATRQNTFKRGDMARCHMVNNSLNQKDYWRIVDETNEYDTFYNGEYGWTDLTNEAHFDVTGTSTCWGYMGASTGDTADVPEMGDDLYQLGSVTDADRQGAIVEATTGNDTPAYRIYQSVGKDLRPTPAQGQPPLSEFDPFTLEDRDYINLFYNSATGRAQMDVYGDAYIGAKDGSTYINYNAGTRKLNIKAIVDIAGGFLDGGTQKTFDQLLSGRTYTQAQVDAMIEGIQEQIDGEIDTWFYDYMPVDFEATEPANKVPLLFYEKDGVSYPCQPYYDWFVADHGDPTTTPITQPTTDVERNKHLGDIFYDNTSGYAFRFSKDENTGDFEWVEITDSAVIKALRDAANAQDTADNKRRVFVSQPAPIPPKTYVEYDVGDLWTNANFTGSDSHGQAVVYSNDLLRCITAKPIRDAQGNITDGTFSIDDWQLASKYTDDTALTNFIAGAYATTISLLQGQIDKKAQTWYQDQNPATTAAPNGWYVQGENHDAEHVGDLWYCTDNIVDPNTQEVIFGKDTTWYFQVDNTGSTPRYYWQQQNIPSEVFDKIDGKCQIFVNDPTATPPSYPTNYQREDLWILPQAATINGVSYIQGEILTSTANSDIYVASHWVKKVGYTNDDTVNAIIQRYGQILNITPTAQDLGQALGYLEKVLSTGSTSVDGGLVLTNIIYMKDVGTTPQVRAGLSGLLKETETGTGWKGYGTAAWYGGGVNNGAPIDKEASPALSNYAKSLFRFDGSGYLAGGNITWDANGSVTIRNITTLYDSQNTNILNELTTFSNMFGNSTWGVEPNTELRIQPKQHFDHINLTRGTGSVGGDSHYFDITDVSVLNYGEMKTRFLQSDLFWLLFGVYSSDGTTDLTSTFISTGALPTGAVIKAKTGLFTDSFLSALGVNPNSGGGGGTGDVTWDALASSQDSRPISWEHIETAVTQQGYITSALLAAYLTTNGYATQSWVGQQGFLTSQDITANLINNALGFTLSGTSGSTYNLDNFALASALSGYLPLTGGTMTGSLKQEAEIHLYDKTAPSRGYARIRQDGSNGLYISWEDQNVGTALTETLNVDGNIYMNTKLVATQNWVGLNYTDTVTLNTMLGNYLLKSGGTMTGTLYMGVGTYFRLYEDANSYASIYASATDGLSIGFNNGATVAAINLDANTEIGGTLGVTGNVTVGHPNTNGGYIQIGGVRLVYDSVNNALYVVSSDGSTAANFYATGGNSALGYSPSGSGGGGTGDVTWTALAAQATNNRTIHSSYIADTLANYLLVSGGTVTGDLTLLGNVFATSAAFNINHLYLTTGFVVQMVDRLNNNQSAFAFDANNNFVFSLGTHNAKFIASNLLVGTDTVWHGGNFPLAISSPTSGQVLKFNGTSWVNDAAPTGGGTVTSITAGTGLSGGTITGSGTIAIDSTYQTYISNGNTAYGWGNHANAGYALASALASYLPLSAGSSYPLTGDLYVSVGKSIYLYQDASHKSRIYSDADGLNIAFDTGASTDFNVSGDISATGNIYAGSNIVATQSWVGQQGFALASAIPTNNNQLTNGAGYITSSALNGYATQTWVGQQGYITSSSISDMATMTWVANQDYVSSSDLNTTLTGYATTSDLNGYLPLSGGRMSGALTFKWGGDNSDQWIYFNSADDTESYRLGFRKPYSSFGLSIYDGDYYIVYTQKNANLHTVDWRCKGLFFENGDGIYAHVDSSGSRKVYGCDSSGACNAMASFAMIPDNDNDDVWQVRPWQGSRSSAYVTVWHGGLVEIHNNLRLDGTIQDSGGRAIFGSDRIDSHTRWCSWMALPDNDADDMWQVRPYGGNRDNAYMTVLHGGNVGIGEVTPLARLHVRGSSSEVLRLGRTTSEYSAGFGAGITFYNGRADEHQATISAGFNQANQGNYADLYFGTRTSDALGVETKMTILYNGNVGIGTTSPSYKFDVRGTVRATGTIYGDSNIEATLSLMAGGDIIADGSITAGTGFYKTNSSDSFVLLGGGGHYALSNFLTSSALNNYLPLSGGTLTGALGGTSGTFSSSLQASGYHSTGSNIMTNYYFGNGTYNILSWMMASNYFEFEFPYLTDDESGTRTAIYFGWRGGLYPLTIAANTNVGISNTNPQHTLDVGGDIHFTGALRFEQSGGIYSGSSISWRQIYGCDSSNNGYSRIISFAMIPDNDADDAWQVRPWLGNYSNAYVTVLHGGNVGIGTTAPSYKLHVNGTIYSSNGDIMVTNGEVKTDSGFVHTSYNSSAYLLRSDGGVTAISNFLTNPLTTALTIKYGGSNSDQWIYFNSSDNTESYRLGIRKPYNRYGLTIYDGEYYLVYTEKNCNLYTVDWKCKGLYIKEGEGIYSHNDYTTRKIYGCDTSDGIHKAFTSYAMIPDNDADDAWQVRPFQGGRSSAYITVLHGGNVGIGTTSTSYKLDVYGTVRATGTIYGDSNIEATLSLMAGGDIIADGSITAGTGFYKTNSSDSFVLLGGGGHMAISSFLTNPMTTHLSFNSSCDIRMYDDSTHYTSIHEDSDGLNIGFANSNSNGNLVVAGGIENTGSVTVGNTLTVNGTTTSVGTIYGSSSLYLEGDLYIRDIFPQGGGAFYWHIDGNGYGVMTVSGGTAVAFTCQVNATSFNQTSDARKKNISDYDIEPNLWDIAYAPAIRYTWKEGRDKANHVGSLAQYWKAILPEAVTESFDGYLGMQYDVIALLSAISIAKKTIEHERRISELERRVGTLESENSYLRSQINELKAA